MANKKQQEWSEPVHVRLKQKTAEKLKNIARDKGVPFSIYLRMLIEEEINKDEKKAS